MTSKRQRRGISKVSVRCGIPFDVIVKYLTGRAVPVPWVERQLEIEFGHDWRRRYAEEAT